MRKRYVIIAVIILAIVATPFLAVGLPLIYFYYLDPAKEHYQEGESLYYMDEYRLAIDEYQKILDKYPDSGYGPKAVDSIVQCYRSWGEELEGEADYEAAIETYQTLMDRFPDNQFVSATERSLSECFLEWASELRDEGKYGEAIEKYQVLIDVYGYPYDEEAEKAIPECCYEWGLHLQGQQRYGEAIEKYQLLIDNYSSYPYLSPKPEAEEAIAWCYYEWVSQLLTMEKYDEALEKYCTITEKYPDTTWASRDKAVILRDLPAEVLFTWAAQLQQEKSYDNAIRLYEGIIEYHPNSQYAPEAEKAIIDVEIAKILEDKYGELPPPTETTIQELEGKVELIIINDTPYALTVLISGPTTTSTIIEPSPGSSEYYMLPFNPPSDAKRTTITLEAGKYKIVAKVDKPDVIPYYGEETYEGDNQYDYWLYVYVTFG